ncbi:biotin-dependent carboxyltransferase family protein [Solihabitans fulvus]|uniref:Biotin-dependent carboxyltransferase family protein n=1 Tax=Solihabitans fulvus TaxID=1892852 RepID=A0A5B2XEK5_9PSEU|nr:biotin-dependent carboxyltransferase family protein [Solihabitans fulvus]KAA2261391.1 biotin-dependent carboxyltransferase family protein [Solihabitans fulvus]
MADVLAVHQAGMVAVTDLGRQGHSRDGIPPNGAADQFSAAVANILVGNRENSPLIEVTASAFAFTTTRAALISVTGAPATLTCGGRPHRMWEPVCVPAGARVAVHNVHNGLRTYVAVHGEFQVPFVLGSCAPDSLLEVGTWLRAGAELAVDTDYVPVDHPVFRHPVFRLAAPTPRFGSPWTIDVTDGPAGADFVDLDRTLLSEPYRITPTSNHIGLRLSGPAPTRLDTRELLSRGVPVGAVEVTPSRELLVLLRGRPVTAGYPVVAVATRVAQSALGQAAPGHVLRFRRQALPDAVAAYRARRRAMDALTARVRTAFGCVGIPCH